MLLVLQSYVGLYKSLEKHTLPIIVALLQLSDVNFEET